MSTASKSISPMSSNPTFGLARPLVLLACLTLCASAQADPAGEAPAAGPGAGRGTVNPAAVQSAVIETAKPARGTAKPAPGPVAIEAGPTRTLAVGDVSTITLPGVVRIAIGNGALLKATVVDDREIVLIAEQAGRTTMHVWLKNGRQLSYEIEVLASRPSRVLDELQGLLKETPGLSARVVGERVVIEGRYQDNLVAQRIKRLGANFPQILNLVPDRPVDADPLQLERMVQIDLRVIEVKKRALDQLGIKWASAAAGPTFATNALIYSNTPWRPDATNGFPAVNTSNPIYSYLGMATQITSALRFLETRGEAWTLAEPRLSCRSGGEANFLAGGEIPIPVAQGNGAVGVIYKQYGVRIEFKPQADGHGNIDSGLMVEVSEPDARNSNAGFIAFSTNRTDTQVAMKEAEPLVISGLLRQRTERSSDAVPGLGRIPIISNLFKSREHTTEQTELIVIATPRIITPDSALTRAGVEKAAGMAELVNERVKDKLKPEPSLTAPEPGQERR
ncbi:type II and III secretion system protein family protein [Roseateles sp. DB2]|uniref:type II and III secretion system protein family protein n=1 Tax=Roseateles sp. DB2 TaxID=3453717 RepID=UPI003EEC90C7